MDQRPFKTARPQRRRLLTHAAVFAVAGVACLVFSPPLASSAPTVQEGRYLEGDSVAMTFSCTGADQATKDLLATFGLNPFDLAVTATSAAVEPSPSPGEQFEVDFTIDYTLPQQLVFSVAGLVSHFIISGGQTPISATAGATGSFVGNGPTQQVDIGDGTVPVGFTEGPFTGTFTRTAEVDGVIEFKLGTITTTATSNNGIAVPLVCTPGAGVLSVTDQDGVAPSTTTTTRPPVVDPTTTVAPTTTAGPVVAGEQLPRTGAGSNLLLVLLALALIDIGYLALSASRDRRVPSAS